MEHARPSFRVNSQRPITYMAWVGRTKTLHPDETKRNLHARTLCETRATPRTLAMAEVTILDGTEAGRRDEPETLQNRWNYDLLAEAEAMVQVERLRLGEVLRRQAENDAKFRTMQDQYDAKQQRLPKKESSYPLMLDGAWSLHARIQERLYEQTLLESPLGTHKVGENKGAERIWIWLDQANGTQGDAGTTPRAIQDENYEAGRLWLEEARGLDQLMPCLISSGEERETDGEARSLSSYSTDIDEDVVVIGVDTACVQKFTTVVPSMVTVVTVPPRRRDFNN
jgi:hypothetical protein